MSFSKKKDNPMEATYEEEDEPERKNCCSRMKINKKLLPLKILMLLIHGGMAALYPYLTVHMRSIGLTFVEIGIIYAILPFVSAIGPAVGGVVADKLGNYKIVMLFCIVLSIITHLLILFGVPSLNSPSISNPNSSSVSNSNFKIEFFDGIFPCGAEENSHFLQSNFIKSGCKIDQINSTIDVFQCSTDCLIDQKENKFPKICLSGQNQNECFFWANFSSRFFSNVQFESSSASKNSVSIKSFIDENERNITWITCLHRDICDVRCRIKSDVMLHCGETHSVSRLKPLALYITFRFLAGIAVNTVIPVLDAVAYQMAADYNGDLGIQRMFSLFGLCVMPPLSGYLVGVSSKQNGFTDYSPAFYLFGAMNFLSLIVLVFMPLSIRIPAVDIIKNVGKILKNPKVFVFILMMFLAGCAWGFLENYLFLFMEDLNSPKWLLGMTGTVSGLAAIPVVAASTLFMRYFGHTKIFILCFLFYGIRFLSYAFIYNPFHVLPVEVLEAITTSLLWVVASVYCGKIAPDYLATLQGIIGTMHYALGRGVGSLIGGIMFNYFKARLTYLIFGGSCIGIGIVYTILHYAWLRNIRSAEEEEEPKPEISAAEELTALPSLRRRLSRKEENDIVQIAKFEAFTPLAMTFSGHSGTPSARSNLSG